MKGLDVNKIYLNDMAAVDVLTNIADVTTTKVKNCLEQSPSVQAAVYDGTNSTQL